jgi:HK97 gp10 family phage protein
MRQFNDIPSLIAHLVAVDLAARKEARAGLEKCAKLIETTAKDKLGYYQEAVGPYPAWEQLSDRTLAEHAALGVGDSPLVLTGGLYASIEHQVNDTEAVIGTKSEIGLYQEIGTDKIPPRPFMGPSLLENEEKIKKIMGDHLVTAIIGGASAPGKE